MAKKDTEIMTAETAEENAAAPPEPQKETIKKLIYAGASVPGMRANTVFEGNIPSVLNVPFVRDCCIEPSQYGKWIKDKLNPKSHAAFCYKKSVEYAGELAAKNN